LSGLFLLELMMWKNNQKTQRISVSEKLIYVACPGGANGPWGMSQMVRYFSEAWRDKERRPLIRIVDTTGFHVGWGRRTITKVWLQPLKYLNAATLIFAAALLGRMSALHLHVAEGGSVLRKLLLMELVRSFGIPTIVHMHAANFPGFYAALPRICRQCVSQSFNHCTKFIVLGKASRDYFVSTVLVEPERISVIPNGIPDPGVTPRLKNTNGCELLFLGTLTRRKGLHELLAALARPELTEQYWRLRIAGAGDPGPWLKLIADLNLDGRASLLGWTDPDKAQVLLAECDVLVLPSHNEALPLVILEAMAHGRPVVTTPVGSISDAITHEVNGLLVEPGNVTSLTKALERMICDPCFRQQMGLNARAVYEAQFTVEHMNDRLAAEFTAALRPIRS
jgi:glycosyltransferase involved in cell wall biosynthesis